MPTKSLYEKVTEGAQALDLNLKAGEMKKFKKLLSPELLDAATRDGLEMQVLERKESRRDVHPNFVGLSRAKNVTDVKEDLEEVQEKLKSRGATLLLDLMETNGLQMWDDTRDVIKAYAKLAMASKAHIFWFTNVLENYYARQDRSEDVLNVARSMCKELGLTVDEKKSSVKW
jgi:hypothetical protein